MESVQHIADRREEIHCILRSLTKITGYPIRYINNQRIFGPRPDMTTSPPHGSEVFVSHIPKDAYEAELVPFFAKVGRIHKLRLMLTPSVINNKGFAFVMYSNPSEASQCIRLLNNYEFRKNCYLQIEKSLDNCRIFVGGIPDTKCKDEVWHELVRNGMSGIVDVIMYRSYTDRRRNRGFVFVEFKSHQEAAEKRTAFKNLRLWENRVYVDWSAPVPEVEPEVMSQVTKIFLRNLDVALSKQALEADIIRIIRNTLVEKVYKFKNYAFVHFSTRRDAQRAMELLKEAYKNTDVEVMWAIPPRYATKSKARQPCRAASFQDTVKVSSVQPPVYVRPNWVCARNQQAAVSTATNYKYQLPEYYNFPDQNNKVSEPDRDQEILKMIRYLGIDA